MTYVLTLLGTDTSFSPVSVADAYDKAETLSYVSTLIHGDPLPTDKVTKYRNTNVAVVDGPTTLGSEVGDRIARGVLSILEAISRGETDISIIAHSRGAVEAILVAHELERIQTLLATADLLNENAVREQLKNSECKYTKAAMNGEHSAAFAELNLGDIAKNIDKVKVSIFNIDPVPGGNYMLVTKASSLAWRDPRFYVVPKIVKEYEQYTYENERTRCFKPIVPKCASPETQFKLCSLPGHHGTGSGNLKSQQRGDIPKGTTEHVQELVLIKIIDFLTRNGVTITAEVKEADPFANKVAELLKEPLTPERLQELYFDLYQQILANKEAYSHFNNTAYATLGQEQAILKWLWKVVDQRIVHYQAHNDTYLESIVPPVPGDHFLNYEHARIHLNKALHLNEKLTLSETIQKASENLLATCRHKTEWKPTALDLSASIMEDKFLPVIETKEGFNLVLEGLGMLIEEVKRPYLQDEFTDRQERAALYEAVSHTFTEFKKFTENNKDNKLAETILKTLNENVEATLQIKRASIEAQYSVLSRKLEKNEVFVSLHSKMEEVIKNLTNLKTEEDAPVEEFLIKFLKKMQEQVNSAPRLFREFIESELRSLNEIEIKTDLGISTRQVASFIMTEAIDDSLGYDIENIMREVIKSYKQLDDFKEALPNFKQLYAELPYDEWALSLAQKRAHMVYLAAQYIAEKELDLEEVIRPLLIENEELYGQIGGLAIGLGAKNPLAEKNKGLVSFMSDLEGQLDRVKKENEELTILLDQANEAHKEELSKLNLAHEEALNSLNIKNGNLESQLASANEEYLRHVEELNQRHESAIALLMKEKGVVVDELDTVNKELIAKTQEHQQVVKELTQKNEELNSELDKLSKEHETALKDLTEQYKLVVKSLESRTDELETATKEYKEQVEQLTQKHQLAVNGLSSQNEELKVELDKVSKEHEIALKELTEKYSLAVQNLEKTTGEFETATKEYKEQVEQLTRKYQLAVDDLTSKNEALRDDLDKANKSHEEAVEKLTKEHQLEVDGLQKKTEEISADLGKAIKDHAQAIKDLTEQHQLEVTELKQNNEGINIRLGEATEAYEKGVKELKANHELAVDQLAKGNEFLRAEFKKAADVHEEAITQLTQTHRFEVQGLTQRNADLSVRLDEANKSFDKAVRELQGTHQLAIDDLTKRNELLNTNFDKRVEEFEKGIKELKQEHQLVVESLTQNQDSLSERLQSTQHALEQSETFVKELLINNQLLLEEKQALNQDKEVVQDELDQTLDILNDKHERKCLQTIDEKLLPLTENYIIHLATEINKVTNNTIDLRGHDIRAIIDDAKDLGDWAQNDSSIKLKQKFDAVSELYNTLTVKHSAQMKPSATVNKFYTELSRADEVIKEHRDSRWMRYTANAAAILTILVTGIGPGILALGLISYFAGTPMKFWESSGQTFFQKSKEEAGSIINSLPDTPTAGG